jgi:hypothetical protein
MTQVCTTGTIFRLDPTTATGITSTALTNDVCTAANLLDRLHREFTEQYVATATTGATVIADALKNNPTFHLRQQPTLTTFNASETAGSTVNRYYSITTRASKPTPDPSYNGMMNAIMKGEYDTTSTDFNAAPTRQANFATPAAFKGLHGLQNLNELLQEKIAETVNAIPPMVTSSTTSLNSSEDYEKRRGIKMTIEEIAHRENQIYREKFLNIILILVGIFLVSTQLVGKYFSFGGGGGGGSGFGFGGVSGWLSNRFGTGSGGIFSRFGGLGLGSSGRSRIGNLFTSNPYSLSRR